MGERLTTVAAPALFLAGCTLISDADIDEKVGVSDDPGDSCAVAQPDYSTVAGAAMIYIPCGAFTMGGGRGDPLLEYVDHEVTLTHGFFVAQSETTRAQWEMSPENEEWSYSSLPSHPCTGRTVDCPADSLTWFDAAKYANWVSAEESLSECYLSDGTDLRATYSGDPYSCPGYRLPTEAEWEYAARAGENTAYSGSDTAGDVAWTDENAIDVGSFAHAVCSLAPNAWGLCDMSGNLWEWTNDAYESDYGGYGSGLPAADPPGPSTGSGRAVRGGGWAYFTSNARVAFRASDGASEVSESDGFRLVRSIP